MTKATKRFKSFGKGSYVEPEPLSFELYDEEFKCVPQIQGSVMLNMVKDSQDPDGAAAASIITDFFGKVLVPESYERFETLINSPDKIVTVETLGEITSWLIQEYTSRPEKQPED